MDLASNTGMWCCIVSRRQNGAVKTRPFLLLRTIAESKRASVAKYEEAVAKDSEVRSLTFERCNRVTIREIMR